MRECRASSETLACDTVHTKTAIRGLANQWIMPETLYIIDGHSYLYKAYYAIRDLSNSRGMPTNAIYGFVQMLNKLIRECQPKCLAVIFDHPGPSFRNNLFADYKAHRPPTPDDLRIQIPWVKRILTAMGVTLIEQEGVEADDVIGTLASTASHQGLNVGIVTADKDLFQLVSESVTILRAQPESIDVYDRQKVKEKIGVFPEQVVDFIALVGDTSDNIPGVPSIGPKTAAQLLSEFGTLGNLLANTQRIANEKRRQVVEKNREQALLSQRLASIKMDVELPVKLQDFSWEFQPNEELVELYRELEFYSLLEGMRAAGPKRQVTYQTIADIEALKEAVEAARRSGYFAVDTETTSEDPMRAALVGISMSSEPNTAFYIPCGHTGHDASLMQQPPLAQVREVLGPLLADASVKKCGQNIKYDLKVLRRHGFSLEGIVFDSMLASYLLNPDKKTHNLKDLALDYFNIVMTPITNLIGKGKSAITMAEVAIERASQYACEDADVTLQLSRTLHERLQEAELLPLFQEIEIPLLEVLNAMEMEGVCIDAPYFSELSREIQRRLNEVASEIYQLAGHMFNINSPKQVAKVLFEELHLPATKKGKSGYSTDVRVLEELSSSHPLPKLLVEYRTYEKLKSTYVDSLPAMVNPRTGRIHTSYNQFVAATGRLTSSEPNLQNIPVRTPQGREIRRGFIASEPSRVLLSADYSQIELRILAHLTEDKALVEAFQRGEDIHRATAARIFGCSPDEVTPEMRDQAKVVNFGIIYGMSAHGVSQQLKIPHDLAEGFIKEYFSAYRGVKRWIDSILQFARSTGYVTTLLNRRRYLSNITSSHGTLRSNAERMAINMPVQGTSADMIKKAMIAIDRVLGGRGLRARMIMQVHDELIFDVPEGEISVVSEIVEREMAGALELRVPVVVSISTGRNWAECSSH
jgi:DNA polymerase-1